MNVSQLAVIASHFNPVVSKIFHVSQKNVVISWSGGTSLNHMFVSKECICKSAQAKGMLFSNMDDSAFTVAGFNSWRKALENFKQHMHYNCHKEAVMKWSMIK